MFCYVTIKKSKFSVFMILRISATTLFRQGTVKFLAEEVFVNNRQLKQKCKLKKKKTWPSILSKFGGHRLKYLLLNIT